MPSATMKGKNTVSTDFVSAGVRRVVGGKYAGRDLLQAQDVNGYQVWYVPTLVGETEVVPVGYGAGRKSALGKWYTLISFEHDNAREG